MSHEHTAFGVLQGLIILGLLWWSWVTFSWLCNHAYADEGIMRVGMMAAMAAIDKEAGSGVAMGSMLKGNTSEPFVVLMLQFCPVLPIKGR